MSTRCGPVVDHLRAADALVDHFSLQPHWRTLEDYKRPQLRFRRDWRSTAIYTIATVHAGPWATTQLAWPVAKNYIKACARRGESPAARHLHSMEGKPFGEL
jgi:hypothetical protein